MAIYSRLPLVARAVSSAGMSFLTRLFFIFVVGWYALSEGVKASDE